MQDRATAISANSVTDTHIYTQVEALLKARSPAESMQDRAEAISANAVTDTGADMGVAKRALATASLSQKSQGT